MSDSLDGRLIPHLHLDVQVYQGLLYLRAALRRLWLLPALVVGGRTRLEMLHLDLMAPFADCFHI